MPTYEYMREDGSVFEFLQSMNDAPLDVCPTTGLKVRRVISGGTGVIYKGDGWYVTDYKNKNGKPATGENRNGTEKSSGDGSGNSSSGSEGDSGKSKSSEGDKPVDKPGGTPSGSDK